MTGIYYEDIIMTIRRDYMTMAGLDMTWAMTMTALHIYIMAFILLINIMRRFHGLYAQMRMARFHALIQMGGTHLHCVQRTVSFSKDGESLTMEFDFGRACSYRSHNDLVILRRRTRK